MRRLPPHMLDGEGWPTIVLLNGAGVTFSHWDKVWPALSELSATFAYDRLPPENARRFPDEIGRDTVNVLRDLLHDTELAPPYLLVGHSMGGLYANLYARLYPNEVAGIVMVDASHPAQLRTMRPHYTTLLRLSDQLTAWLDAGLGPGKLTEVVHFEHIAAEVEAAGPFPDIPLTVLTAGRRPPRWVMPDPLHEQHLANQRALARLAPRGRQVIVDSTHLMPRDRPEAIIDAVATMLHELRHAS